MSQISGGTGWSVAIAQVLNKPLYVFDLDMEHWYRWYPTLQQYQHCEGMTEEHVCLPTLQDKTTIVGTREEVCQDEKRLSEHKSSPQVLAAAAIFSRMRAWGRGALPINKMSSPSSFGHRFVLHVE